ncbi:restriction endonuclease subunit S [Sinanaerobacter sp. ZZT-01]|uniref:restriction endonuclease subunit S n=1 Tax=Sinanaerobacter sp. ZZT-01 TaxID=3111540 RepID=UPI002D78AA45|nr:restriction endonuclease subunit S [Sinanaerobacter sp. ZZT-01]WRR93959.1 restriction endonuclease subunit S [Sinanaerobacter sp. ZZT-01]
MSEWTDYRLSEFMDFNPTTPLRKNTECKKVAMENLGINSRKVLGWEIARFNGGAKFMNGDTLVARITPCLENGKIGFVDFLDDGEVAFGSTEFIVLRKKAGISTQQFVYYFAYWNEFRDLAVQLMTGTSGRQRVETDVLKQRVFRFPDIPTQQTIAEVLASLDDKIDLLTRQNTTLEALTQTYFRQWFLEENENDPIPVSDIATLENNSVNPGRKPLEPFYHYSIPAFDTAQTPAVELGKAILSNKFCVLPNTILVSKLNPVTPRIWRIGEKVQPNSVCSTEFQVLRPKDMRHYLFLYCLMKSKDVVSSFAMSATGTSGSHQRIRPEYILEVETPAPDDEKLALFNEVCAPMMERVMKNQKQILTLQKLRDTLLPKLLSGEVRVKQ